QAIEAAAKINHESSAIAARAERGVLERFGTRLDCYSAIAVHYDGTRLRAFLSNGQRSIRAEGTTPDEVYGALAAQGAEGML
ncbi:MAG: hypothetical protein ACLGH0_03555, partial [Thermoanaerobaculia bacterium]